MVHGTQRTRRWWLRRQQSLVHYSDHCSPSSWGCFTNREGRFVLIRTAVLVALLWAAAYSPHRPYVVVLSMVIALALVVDTLLKNTVIVFVTGSALDPLRSMVLTMGAYVDIALGFAVWWVGVAKQGGWHDGPVKALYESVRTLTTAGPETPPVWWGGQLLVVAELLAGIYFIAIVIAIYASWARTGRP